MNLQTFRPLPFLRNPHLQTVLGNLGKGGSLPGPVVRRQILLPDGDRLMAHVSTPRTWLPGDRTAILVHGLGGSHQSGYMQRMARLLLRARLRVVRLDLRGVGAGAALAGRTYHGGCSPDVRAAVLEVARGCESPVVLVGFSLGGNIVLKLAGETAAEPLSGLQAVAALAPPIDLESSACRLALPGHGLYEQYYIRSLLHQVRRHRRHFPDFPPLRFPRRMTLRLLDDLYTAPNWGFADALDYYRRASAAPLVEKIQCPAFILSARDDPFISPETLEKIRPGPRTQMHLADHGGHLGFLGWDGNGGIRWAERRLADWIIHLK